jgi:hypothetical protein
MSDIQPTLTCANHPTVETLLRCNRCEKPICLKCAVLTPTGYRCKECVRGQQKIFETIKTIDYPIAAVVAGGLAFLGSLILPQWLLLAILGSPVVGTVIAEAVRLAVRRRWSKQLGMVAAIATGLGCLPVLGYNLVITGVALTQFGIQGGVPFFTLVSSGIYLALVTSTVFYRLRGFSLKV